MNIVNQASKLFEEVVVAIMVNPSKKTSMFSMEERYEMIETIYKNIKNVEVIIGYGSAVDVAMENGCNAIVRGLRSLSDFDYEVQLQQINNEISDGKVNTVCLFADKEYQFVSSSMVKEVFNLDKDISRYVDPYVYKRMKDKKRG